MSVVQSFIDPLHVTSRSTRANSERHDGRRKSYSVDGRQAKLVRVCVRSSYKMVISCCAVGCANRQGKANTSFYRIPFDGERRHRWIAAIRRKDWQPSKYSRICSEHFLQGKNHFLVTCNSFFVIPYRHPCPNGDPVKLSFNINEQVLPASVRLCSLPIHTDRPSLTVSSVTLSHTKNKQRRFCI